MNILIGVLLVVGCSLSIPVYWWLFVSPLVRLVACLLPRTSARPTNSTPASTQAAKCTRFASTNPHKFKNHSQTTVHQIQLEI